MYKPIRSDNNDLSHTSFSSPFDLGFFRIALRDFTDLRKICYAGILTALSVAFQAFSIRLIPGLSIQFSFIVSALAGAVLGPYMSFVRGCLSDIIGFFAFPSGSTFFLGYTLSAGLSALTYSLFFYRQKVTFARILGAKAIVNVFVNASLGSCWNVMILSANKGYMAYFATAISKNLIMFPLEVCVLILAFSSLIPILYRVGAVHSDTELKYSKNQLIITAVLALIIAILIVLWFIYREPLSSKLKEIYSEVKNFMNKLLT
ncbi:MAG: folate family ECF transporter S component [Eubacteriales bacterium]|nr:folate family ECF transporter S component [Eubacteriales bacterium]